MMNLFYYSLLVDSSKTIELQGIEANHMVRSRRLKPDDQITLFNGEGRVAQAVITAVGTKYVELSVFQTNKLEKPVPEIVLASAIPKGERFGTMLDMATQLGMTAFIPLACERSVVKKIDKKTDRYKRICINACKQSQRFFVPQIYPMMTPSQLIERALKTNQKLFLADPDASQQGDIEVCSSDCTDVVLIVGPEGGFSNQELELFAKCKIENIRLSNAILRIETAAVSFLAKLIIDKTT